MDRLPRWIIKRRLLVLLATLVLITAGTVAWWRLPIDAFPDVTNVQVMVLTEAPGLSPVDVERQVTYPVELELSGLPRVREVRSLSKATLSQVVVVFEDGVDIYFARQLVFQRLSRVRQRLPQGLQPELGPVSTGLGEIYQYTVESKTLGLMERRTLQDWVIGRQLRSVAGVNEVNSFGGLVRQVHVEVRPEALLKYGIALSDVTRALAENNANAGGSYILKGWEQAYVRSVGLLRSQADLERIVLRAQDGTPVLLRDVATVKTGAQTRQGAVTRDGKGETVAGMVIMLKGENSKQVVERVRRKIPAIQATLPPGVQIQTYYDRSALIEATIGTVSSALLQGGLLVLAVLLLFLWNLRAALTVALSLPLTGLVAVILMDLTDLTANLMSLGGLAIAIGMVVDGAVVVTENVVRHLGHNDNPRKAARRATAEVIRPVLFSILIVIVVFVPLLALEQMEGKMFRPLALTMIYAMLGSLLVALTVVPALTATLLLPTRPMGKPGGEPRRADGWLWRGYSRLLELALRRRRSTVALALALLAGSLGLVPLLGVEFLPELDEGAIAINVVRLPSASLEGSVQVGGVLERKLLRFPEVQTVVTRTGRAEISEDPMGPEQSDMIVVLKPRASWSSGRTKDQLVQAMRQRLGQVPGLRLSFSQPIALRVNELISGIKSDVAVKIFGPDLQRLKRAAEQLGQQLNGMAGATDVSVEQVSGFAQLELHIDRDAIARYHLNIADINQVIETAVGGSVATELSREERRFAVQVRFPEAQRGDAEAIGRILLRTPEGARVPLSRVARLREVEAPAQISRQDGSRRIVVECNVHGGDLAGFVDALRPRLNALQRSLPPGYRVELGGQFENQQRAMTRLSWVVPLAIGLIVLLLFGAFGSLRHALLVLANLPFALVGGVVILALTGYTVSVAAVVGFIALFGIAVENGVVLVAFFNQLRKKGRSPLEAVREGARLRLRPLLMTTSTTLLGLTPMLIAAGPGSSIQRPLAAVVLAGLMSSTALTLLVLPALYAWVEDRGRAGS